MLITDQQTINDFYQALVDKNPSYVGIFFVGVKTTSVFCIATCRARKPKFENVEFFTTFESALHHGYRPCKLCKPTENAHEAPTDVQQAIDLVRKNPKVKISDYELKQQGIQPEKIRRWFNKHYGITFHKFQRMYRINNAIIELKNGKKIIDSALDSGYNSLSGFGYTYKKTTGHTPNNTDNPPILMDRFTTPLGPMFVCATPKGICLLEFVDRRMLETEFKDLQRLLNTQIIMGENQHTQHAKQEIKHYFDGHLKNFSVSLDTPGTDFQKTVWSALIKTEYGQTLCYQDLAKAIGKDNAVRAVANANGHNRVAIIVPCHRIIGKDGHLTGYGGGLERKRWLLNHEQNR